MQPAGFRKLTGFMALSATPVVIAAASPALAAPIAAGSMASAAPYALALGATGFGVLSALLALKWRRDADAAAAILAEHMAEAEQHMLGLQARLMDRFLSEVATPRRVRRRRIP